MKNTNETLASEKFYTTRMSDCVNRQVDFEGYVIRIKGYPDKFEAKRCFNPEKDKKVFLKGEGWKAVKKNNIFPITVPKVENYTQVLELVEKYGYRCASEMIGFQLSSYGDHYPISDVAKMETYGKSYIEYLERIASMDYKILQYLTLELKLKISNNSYDMWIKTANKQENDFKCSFRTNPFLGFHLATCYYGTFPVTPHINPISFDESLWKVISEFHPDYQHNEDIDKLSELKIKYDKISVRGWVEIMCGKDDAEWLAENLTFVGQQLVC